MGTNERISNILQCVNVLKLMFFSRPNQSFRSSGSQILHPVSRKFNQLYTCMSSRIAPVIMMVQRDYEHVNSTRDSEIPQVLGTSDQGIVKILYFYDSLLAIMLIDRSQDLIMAQWTDVTVHVDALFAPACDAMDTPCQDSER